MSGEIMLAAFLIGWFGFAIFARFVLRKSLIIALGGGFIVGVLVLMPIAFVHDLSKPSNNSVASNQAKANNSENTKVATPTNILVTASEATNEFRRNELAAKNKYSNSTIIIGTLYGVDENPLDKKKRVRLKFEHDSEPFLHLTATLIEGADQRAQAAKLSVKDFIRVECKKFTGGVLWPDFEDCVLLPSPKVNDPSVKATEVDAVAMAVDLKGAKEKIKQYFGSVVQAKIFVERYQTEIGGIKRLIDGNSGFFCDIDSMYSSQFPNQRGSYVVKGILIVTEGKVGLSNCQFVSN